MEDIEGLIEDLEDVVIFDIIDNVDQLLGRYPESLWHIRHDLAEKKFVLGRGWWVGSGSVFL